MKQLPTEEHLPSTLDVDEPLSRQLSTGSPQQKSMESQQTGQTAILSSNDDMYTSKKDRTSTPTITKSTRVSDERKIAKENGQSGNSFKRWFE